ncbi:bacterio-opsin activator domain-containing protein [Halorarum salinum]|uniref:GAF domain-containing protein n=1 Tax=Halorarum salinum TaxID=2743089 RepID=A0A7D5L9U5_9EURY|nr:bacterio-opsin activator domain-containing protein [Halobaculum salinum]QLG61448.1 GAF domain-containing protein [Halobaculum salinum]
MTATTRILYVDGDGDRRADAVAALEADVPGAAVRTRGAAEGAMDHLADRPPDCLVTTADLPDADALSFLRRVREERPALPCLLFTDRDDEAVAREARSVDGVEYLHRSGGAGLLALADRIAALTGRATGTDTERSDGRSRALTGPAAVGKDRSGRPPADRGLAALADVPKRLRAADSDREISDVVVEGAGDAVGFPITAVQLYDEGSGRLRPAARTEAVSGLVGDGRLLASGEDLPWQAFVTQEGTVYDDPSAGTAPAESDASLRSAVVLPLGEHGAFVTGATGERPCSAVDVHLSELLAGIAVAAFERVDRERALRERAEALEARDATLERVRRSNAIIRGIVGDLIRATSREEVVTTACDRLVASGPFRFAWIGTYDRGAGTLSPEASAGDGDGYLDAVTAGDGEVPRGEPTEVAARTRETRALSAAAPDPPFDPWQRAALERGYGSIVAVPLVHRDALYGVLGLYTDRTDAFTDAETEVFAELGRTMGYALNALERRQALVNEESVELEFRVVDETDPILGFVEGTGSEFEFENVVLDDERLRAFFTISGATAARVVEFGERSPLEDVTLVADREGGSLFSCTLAETALVSVLVDRGAIPRTITAADGDGRFVIRIPRSADLRTFVELFEARYDEVELVARRGVDEPIRSRGAFQSEFETRLTDRQAEVIEAAHVCGFFEWPRETTAQELAGSLGVSQPTVSRHIREGERKLFDLLFGSE